VVFPRRLSDRHDTDAEPLAQQLLVTVELDRAAREARGEKDEHHVELALGGIGYQPLELRPRLRFAPTSVKVALLR
jgi:hypothetical protein